MDKELSLAILYFAFTATAWGFVGLRIRGRLNLLYSQPLYMFILAVGMIYGLVPLLKKLYGIQSYPFYYSVSAEVFAILLVGIYVLSCVVGYILAGGFIRQSLPLVRPLTRRESFRLFLLVGAPSFLALVYLLQMISAHDFSEYMKNRIMVRRGMGPVVVVSFASVCYGAALLVNYLSQRRAGNDKWTQIVHLAAVGLAVTLIFTVIGNRNFAFTYLAICGLAVMSTIRVQLHKSLLVLPLMICLAFGFSLWAKVRNSPDTANINAVLGGGVPELVVSGLSGGFGNGENLVWLSQHSDEWDPLYGATVGAALVNPVPRAIWPNKPFGGGPALRNIIYPGSYVLDGERITSYTTGAPTEGYINFGALGVLFFGVVNGALLGIVKRVYRRRSQVTGVGVVMYSFTIFMLAFGFLYMELLGGWSRYFIVSLMLVSVAWMGNRRIVVGQRSEL